MKESLICDDQQFHQNKQPCVNSQLNAEKIMTSGVIKPNPVY